MLMMMKNGGMDAHQVDIDSEFEPHGRSRSCTWPLPCPEDFPGGEEASRGLALASVKVEQYNVPACLAERKGGAPAEIKHPAGAPAPVVAAPACMSGAALDVAGQLRKAKSSRRNAWGNLSYADLITRAIESTPEKRLTLSQIYDWMVRFVPYFKDKGDSNSSAGWKAVLYTESDRQVGAHRLYLKASRSSATSGRWREAGREKMEREAAAVAVAPAAEHIDSGLNARDAPAPAEDREGNRSSTVEQA
ncbi:Forkhead box protein O6 [Liparis tanakae]|uniref:Forkhead box protein O6 n=1 Tax=Liparis tanakae TaxID=230148 RepID=A0A4Z2J8P8_9TELE|nr:Forkhead box protein O6 [Liparis tanakae]